MIIRRGVERVSGIEEIDVLQSELLDRAARLVAAARAEQAPEARAHVERMREVAAALFASEERHLRQAGSLSAERHAHEHRRFLQDLSVVGAELGRLGGKALTDLQVARWVTEWLEAHVGRTDEELARLGPAVRA
ncbi:MAG TPA: hemerythrin domain-containing protein [Anaeromyxobacteraceae bacterium]|nr:hemerythrin domain-containing protein [Anaeromyxobacteraceae bacterium]